MAARRQPAAVLSLRQQAGIDICDYDQLTPDQQAYLHKHFQKEIYPILTPLTVDPGHPFPFISNLSLNLLVATSEPTSEHQFLNRIKVPLGVGVPRFIAVAKKDQFITFEDLIANNLQELFPGLKIHSYEYFRVTRNANTDRREEQANDLLAMIESALRDRKFADIVRLQTATNIAPHHRGMLAAELGIDEQAESIAMSLLGRAQGIATITYVFSDPAFFDQEVTQLKQWLLDSIRSQT